VEALDFNAKEIECLLKGCGAGVCQRVQLITLDRHPDNNELRCVVCVRIIGIN